MENLAHLLGIGESMLDVLDKTMRVATGRENILESIEQQRLARLAEFRRAVAVTDAAGADGTRLRLEQVLLSAETKLIRHVKTLSGQSEFEQAAALAREIATVSPGFFLKKSYAREILRVRPPQNLLAFFGYKGVDELLAHHDVTETFSALRFMESTEWMHGTFEAAYGGFTAADFEERSIEVKVLGPEWREVAEKFVAKKHHNVSHLKEFGVIFLNPIQEDAPGKFVRDFALLLHYFHEIEFYSRLFRQYAAAPDFAGKLKMLLRGDVPPVQGIALGEWLIIQRYLFKENPADPRLFLPRVNPESLHWRRGERDLTRFGARYLPELAPWAEADWVGDITSGGETVSFDLEDIAMSAVAAGQKQKEVFTYHQREALWTKLFSEYAGGEGQMEQLLLDNFARGIISFV